MAMSNAERQRRWKANHKELVAERNREYWAKNRDVLNAKQREKHRKKKLEEQGKTEGAE